MSYTINLTNGSIFATIPDGTINSDSSLVVIGRNYNGYGEFVAENFMRLLENHANGTAPSAPLTGQMWYDSNAAILKVYNGTTFKNLGTATSQSSEPVTPVPGDLWYDTVAAQLKMFNGTDYILIGPLYSTSTGTAGPIVETIQDTGALDHVVTITYSENAVIAIFSKDAEFTPAIPIDGFTTIKPGIQLSTDIAGEFPRFVGSATNAELLDNLDSTQFLRSDENDVTSGTLGVLNDTGLVVGADSDLQLSVDGPNVYLTNKTTDGQLVIQAHPQGSSRDVITIAIDGATARARVDTPLNGLDVPNKNYVDDADTILGNTKLSLDGSLAMTGSLSVGNNIIYNLGNATSGGHAVNRTTGDGRYVGKDLDSNVNTGGGTLLRVYNVAGDTGNNTSQVNTLQVYQPTTGKDAFQSFHVGGDYAVHFGLDGATNDLFVGGWSKGAVKHKIWHAGNDGTGSGLDADLLDGQDASSYSKLVIGSPVLIVSRDQLKASSGVTYSNTIPYGVPSDADWVLIRVRMSCNGHTDLRYMYYTINGILVAGNGSDDTDQAGAQTAHSVADFWVHKSWTSGQWTYKNANGTTTLRIYRIGYRWN